MSAGKHGRVGYRRECTCVRGTLSSEDGECVPQEAAVIQFYFCLFCNIMVKRLKNMFLIKMRPMEKRYCVGNSTRSKTGLFAEIQQILFCSAKQIIFLFYHLVIIFGDYI